MGKRGESENQTQKRSLQLRARARISANSAQAGRVPFLKPLVVRRICQGSNPPFRPPRKLQLQDEDSRAQLPKEGDILLGPALRESTSVTDSRSAPPASRRCEEFIVPDSPEEIWSAKQGAIFPGPVPRESKSVTDLRGAPQASRRFVGLKVPDSPVETWPGKQSASFPGPGPRENKSATDWRCTPPASGEFVGLIVPDSPEETCSGKQGGMFPESTNATDSRCTPPASRKVEEFIVPDSQEDTCSGKQGTISPVERQGTIVPGSGHKRGKSAIDLDCIPPASRNNLGLIVPDSPEETWSGNDSSRRPLELPRTRPPASNIEEWFVPETPDETWASPRKLSPIVLPSTKLEELIVPDSPEESKGTFHRSGTLRRIGLSKVRLKSVDVTDNDDSGRVCSESFSSRIAKHGVKLNVKSSLDSQSSDRSHQHGVRFLVQATQKINTTISDRPTKIDANRDLLQGPEYRQALHVKRIPMANNGDSSGSACLPRRQSSGKLFAKSAKGRNKAQLFLTEEDLGNCPKSQLVSHGKSLSACVPGTEDAAPILPFTVSGMIETPSTAVKKPKTLLGDGPVTNVETYPGAGTRFQRNLHRDVQSSVSSSTPTPAPTTPFPTVGEKPGSVCLRPLKKAKAIRAYDLDSENRAGLSRFRSPRNVSSTPMTGYEDAVPGSHFVAGGTNPVSVCSAPLRKGRTVMGAEVEVTEIASEFSEAGHRNVCRNGQTFKAFGTEDAALRRYSSMGTGKNLYDLHTPPSKAMEGVVSISSFITGSGKPVSVSSLALRKAKTLFGAEDDCTEMNARFSEAASQGNAQTSIVKTDDEPPMASSVAVGNTSASNVVQARISVGIDVALPSACRESEIEKPSLLSSAALVKARTLIGDKLKRSERCHGPSAEAGYHWNGHMHGQTSDVSISRDPPPLSSSFMGGGNTLSSSRDSQTYTHTAIGGAVSVVPFSTGNGNSVLVSSTLKKGMALLGDEVKGSDNRPELAGAGYKGKVCQDFSSVSSTTKIAASTNSSSMKKGKTLSGDHIPSVNVFHNAVPTTSFVTGSGNPVSISPVALEMARVLGGVLDNSESRADLVGADDEENDIGNVTDSKFSISEDVPRTNSPIACGKSLSAPRLVTSKAIDNPVSISSFVTGSGKSVSVSFEALEKARGIFEDDFEETVTRAEFARANEQSGLRKTVRNTAIQDAAKAPTIANFNSSSDMAMSVTSMSMSNGAVDVRIAGGGTSIGFCTGSGTTITVASSALEKARIRVRDSDGECKDGSKPRRNPDLGKQIATFKDTVLRNPVTGGTIARSSSSVGGNCQRRKVLPFKAPRMRNQPVNIVPSKDISGSNSCGNKPNSLDAFMDVHGLQRQRPSRTMYLLDRKGSSVSGRRKLREYIREIPACIFEELSISTDRTSLTSDAAAIFRFVHVTKSGRWEGVGSSEYFRLLPGLGADAQYASEGWVANHYKWIIWKLVSSERMYCRRGDRRPVTFDTVLQELKYRYDTELSGRRSAIRRVTEGDSSASKTMILCVSAIRFNGDHEIMDERSGEMSSRRTAKIEVTDGWYRLNAVLDAPLTELFRVGKLKVGQKLQVCGARLRCCSVPKPPLEAFKDSFLTLHMNGTRIARPHSRLGFCRKRFRPLAFRCISPGGGLIHETHVAVTRVYPVLFKEMFGDGSSITRSARAEEQAANEFAQRRANVVEETILKLENSCNISIPQEEKDEDDDLFEAVESSAEPEILMAGMTAAQLRAFPGYQAKREAKRQSAMEEAVKESLEQAGLCSRSVKSFLKARVTGLNRLGDGSRQVAREAKEGTITIWNFSDDLDIKEGSAYSVSGLMPVDWVDKSSGNEGQLLLQSYHYATWCHVPRAIYEKHFSFCYARRASTKLSDIDKCREFDVAAAVLHIEEPSSRGSRTTQWVFVSDGSRSISRPGNSSGDIQILAVCVSLPSSAFAPVDPTLLGSVVGFSNLRQLPKDNKNSFLVAEASELSVISSNWTTRPVKHLQAACESVSKWIKSSSWELDSVRCVVQGLHHRGL